MLNVVRLDPGQALFLPAGVPHSYLEGTGVEIMANSDNVVRGGLTAKHIDVSELLRVLRFEPLTPVPVSVERPGLCETRYLTPAAELVLSALRIKSGEDYHSPVRESVEILLCVNGHARLVESAPDGRTLDISRGSAVIVPAAAPDYHLKGLADLYRAGVPGDAP